MDIERDKYILKQIEERGLTEDKNIQMYSDYIVGTIAEYGRDSASEFVSEMKKLREALLRSLSYTDDLERAQELYWQTEFFLAPYNFESYLMYMEKDRKFEKKFYAPRRNPLRKAVQDLQDLEDGKYKFYGLSLPPRVGKSTTGCFFLSWIMGKRPDSHNAMAGHSGILANGFYNEILNIVTSADYHFLEIFPSATIQKKNADLKEINLGNPDRFATMTCRGIDGTWTGEVDISADGYLYCDDMVKDRMESLSPSRLDSKYQSYLNVLTDRKNDGSREIQIGTRWNVLDPLGRIEEQFKHDKRYFFRKIPALNEKGESNFQYPVKGFSTEYFEEVKERLDPNEWMAKYMQKPFIREGLLFPEDELRFFNGVLPEGEYSVVSACDVAWGGGDSLSMPIGYQYDNGDIYIVDWVFNSGAKEETMPLVTGHIMKHKVSQINFEADNGGAMYSSEIDNRLRSHNYMCSITSTTADRRTKKRDKIIRYSGEIKRSCIFLADNADIKYAAQSDDKKTKRYYRSQEYENAMAELCMFVTTGKNEHDDAPDGITQLVQFAIGNLEPEAEVYQRWF